MLQRPEIGTREHIKLWLASKDPDAMIDWLNAEECATATYAGEQLGDRNARGNTPDLCELDSIARDLASANRTQPCRLISFGELHTAVAVAWS